MSIQFGALEYAKRVFAATNLANGRGGEGGKMLSGGQLFIAGVGAGLANGFVSGPVEHIRIREQFNIYPPVHLLIGRRVTDTIQHQPHVFWSL